MAGILQALAQGASAGLDAYGDQATRRISERAEKRREDALEQRQRNLVALNDEYSKKRIKEQREYEKTQKGSNKVLDGRELTKEELSELNAEDAARTTSVLSFKEGQEAKQLEATLAAEKRKTENAIKIIRAKSTGLTSKDQEFALKQRKAYYDTFEAEVKRLTDNGLKPVTPQIENQAKQSAYQISGLAPEGSKGGVDVDSLYNSVTGEKPTPTPILDTPMFGPSDPNNWEVERKAGKYYLKTEQGDVEMTPEEVKEYNQINSGANKIVERRKKLMNFFKSLSTSPFPEIENPYGRRN